MIVTSLSLVTCDLYVDPRVRGSVAGCYSVCGGLGLLVSSKLGGLLLDIWKPTAPFLVVAIFSLLCVVIALVVIAREHLNK